MDFPEFEPILNEFIVSNKTLNFGPRFKRLDYSRINMEATIQYNLIGFMGYGDLKETVEYAFSALEKSTLWLPKMRYHLFLIKNIDKKIKYDFAKSFVEFFVSSKEEIYTHETDLDLITESFIALMEICVPMNIRTGDIWNCTIEYLSAFNHLIYRLAPKMMRIIGEDAGRLEIIKSILDSKLLIDVNTGNHRTIERFLDEIERLKKFYVEIDLVKRRLAETYMKRIELENPHIRSIHLAQKAASIYKKLNDNEETTKCLLVHSKLLESDSLEWIEEEVELSSHHNDELIENTQYIKEFFSDTTKSITDRITSLAITTANKEAEALVAGYRPLVFKIEIEGVERCLKKSDIQELFNVVTYDESKVIANGDNSTIRAREVAYNLHKITHIIPAISAVENSEDYTIDGWREVFKSCSLVTVDEMNFINEALSDYASNRWIPFICVITPSFESILRSLYAELEGTTVQTKNNDPLVHTTVNLTSILTSEKIKQVLSQDLVGYLEYLLNSETSAENIRNNVAHRFVESDFYTQERSRVLLHALLQITVKINYYLETA